MKHLTDYKVVFWDFDGVIKNSQDAKANGFFELFADYGLEVQIRVKAHHRANGGVSRFKKIPYYFKEFLGQDISEEKANKLAQKFGALSHEATIASAWVTGILEYFSANSQSQDFYIVTGTPTEEIKITCERLEITKFFKELYGSPEEKEDIIKQVMETHNYNRSDAIMVGDALKDQEAAEANDIAFLLVESSENEELFSNYQGPRVKDLTPFLGV
ncbi:MAG: HAD hydrolase-like protein [SAR324 cluster bacterium]|nr:HAD hydrolase-like protein [SAR324 cluster bacterium]